MFGWDAWAAIGTLALAAAAIVLAWVTATTGNTDPIMRFVDWHGNLYFQYRHYTQRFGQNTNWGEAAPDH